MYRNVTEGLVFLIISDVKHLFMCFRAILIYCFLSDFKKIQDQQKRQINVQRQEKKEWIIDAVLTDNKDNADSVTPLFQGENSSGSKEERQSHI